MGPTLPSNAERKVAPAPIAAKLCRGGRLGLCLRRCLQTTVNRRNRPNSRVRGARGAVAKTYPPIKPRGTAPIVNQPTTAQLSSRRLNHTRDPFPMSWATVKMGIASRMPKKATSAGSSTAAPPKPEMAAIVAATKATIASRTHWKTGGR